MLQSENSTFKSIIQEICTIIDKEIKTEISIFLIGSYGRDEGTFDKNGHPLRDIDLAIVLHKCTKIKLEEIKTSLQNSKSLSKVTIDLHFYTLESLIDVLPFFRFYDIKKMSKLIKGKDIQDCICNFNSSDISKYDGLRMLAGELLKIMREGEINKKKLYYILKSADNIKKGCYGTKVEFRSQISMHEFLDYASKYYDGGYKTCAKSHLQSIINYIIRKKISINIRRSFIFSFTAQVFWTIKWAIETKNIEVLTDWRDPALRILYLIIYFFNTNIEEDYKIRLFKKTAFTTDKYSKENIIKLYDKYFLGNKWKAIRKSNWQPNAQVVIK